MKSILIYIFFFLFIFTCKAQNVGINYTIPFMPLTVGADATGVGIKQYNGSSELKLVSTTNQALSTLKASGNLHFATNGLTVPAMSLTSTGLAVGLSGNTASYLLDLKGRMRIQNDATNNLRPAIWFDGLTAQSLGRSAFETINDSYFGITSNNAGNPFVLNNTSGNVGMGNIFPGAKLDLIGSLRIRGLVGSSPTAGSIMASADVNGNGKWQGIAAFRAGGIYPEPGISQLKIFANTWTKLEFSLVSYNKGLPFLPQSNQFVAPVKGVYHIAASSKLDFITPQAAISFGGTRNGANLLLPYKYIVNGSISDDGNIAALLEQNHLYISTEILLEAGDTVWVNVYSTVQNYIGNDPSQTWFTGRLITRL